MTTQTEHYVIGAGGHAKVIIQALHLLGHRVAAVFDDDVSKHGREVAGATVVGGCDKLHSFASLPTVVGVGDNRARQMIVKRFDLDWATVIHPHAVVDATSKIGRGCVIMAGAVVQAECDVHEHCIINTGATVDHDCEIRAFCHVAPGANVAGHCQFGVGVLAGIGSCFIPGIRVGDWSTVGAGAAVVSDHPANVTVIGVPARQWQPSDPRTESRDPI